MAKKLDAAGEDAAPEFKLPVKPLHNPLSADDEAALNYVLNRLPIIEDLLRRAADCGLDVTQRYEQHMMHQAVAAKLKERFFPDELPTAQEG